MDTLELRLRRLERTNRCLALALLAVASCAALGWRASSTAEVLRARRIEVVDARGVPLASLDGGRGDEGGSLTLRDREGERRAWFSTAPGTANLGLSGGVVDSPSASVGLAVSAKRAHVAITEGRAVASTSIEAERPKLEITDAEGRSVFSAPWKR